MGPQQCSHAAAGFGAPRVSKADHAHIEAPMHDVFNYSKCEHRRDEGGRCEGPNQGGKGRGNSYAALSDTSAENATEENQAPPGNQPATAITATVPVVDAITATVQVAGVGSSINLQD